MAGLPGTKTEKNDNVKPANPVPPSTPAVPAAPATPSLPSLNFVDSEKVPTAAQRNMSENPFQEKVNELSRTGRASYVDIPAKNEDWARSQIRRACNNIGKGADTATEKLGNGNVRVHFGVKEKRQRRTNSNAAE